MLAELVPVFPFVHQAQVSTLSVFGLNRTNAARTGRRHLDFDTRRFFLRTGFTRQFAKRHLRFSVGLRRGRSSLVSLVHDIPAILSRM